MDGQFGGLVWLVVVAGGAAALAAALIVASAMWLARDRDQDAMTEQSTRQEYDDEIEAPVRQDRDEPVD